jgi:hypothetical protein
MPNDQQLRVSGHEQLGAMGGRMSMKRAGRCWDGDAQSGELHE